MWCKCWWLQNFLTFNEIHIRTLWSRRMRQHECSAFKSCSLRNLTSTYLYCNEISTTSMHIFLYDHFWSRLLKSTYSSIFIYSIAIWRIKLSFTLNKSTSLFTNKILINRGFYRYLSSFIHIEFCDEDIKWVKTSKIQLYLFEVCSFVDYFCLIFIKKHHASRNSKYLL